LAQVRVRLIAHRLSIDANDRRQHSVKIALHLSLPLFERTVSFFWPFRGEPDLRPLMQIVLEGGGRCALPVVVEKKGSARLSPLATRRQARAWSLEYSDSR
jgi:5-formyltetrahydrofolate cyclo-ligase